MIEATPSRTAYRVALRRAAHQVFDRPVVFDDPLAMRILGMTERHVRSGELRAPQRASSRSLRAFLVARSRFAEDTLRGAVARGATQYVLLGAGLDTFAYRNPWPALQVFEVDHPATQAWKQQMLATNGIPMPDNCRHVPVNFEQANALPQQLLAAGFQPDEPAVWAWLGVVPYLTREAFEETLGAIATLSGRADLVLDYSLPRAMLQAQEQLAFDSLSLRVQQAGEPFRLFFAPAEMAASLQSHGWQVQQELDPAAINAHYFADRADEFKMRGQAARLVHARRYPAGVGRQSGFTS